MAISIGEEGASAVEYALLLALIVLVVAVAVQALGIGVDGLYCFILDSVASLGLGDGC